MFQITECTNVYLHTTSVNTLYAPKETHFLTNNFCPVFKRMALASDTSEIGPWLQDAEWKFQEAASLRQACNKDTLINAEFIVHSPLLSSHIWAVMCHTPSGREAGCLTEDHLSAFFKFEWRTVWFPGRGFTGSGYRRKARWRIK